jgi:ABC-type Mn2+/Zn2+ transport system ATPase subunit
VIDACLERTGLLPGLVDHAARSSVAPREVAAAELSGGERQRMLIARALAQDAELVVLDEPEVGLDADGRARLRELLDELARSRRVIVVAHDESVVPAGFARLVCGTERSG